MSRPEPRIAAWIHFKETRTALKAHGSATIFGTEAHAKVCRPGERAVRVTIIVHVPRVKRRRKQRLTGAALKAVELARKKRGVGDE